jgi:hypothetical protein
MVLLVSSQFGVCYVNYFYFFTIRSYKVGYFYFRPSPVRTPPLPVYGPRSEPPSGRSSPAAARPSPTPTPPLPVHGPRSEPPSGRNSPMPERPSPGLRRLQPHHCRYMDQGPNRRQAGTSPVRLRTPTPAPTSPPATTIAGTGGRRSSSSSQASSRAGSNHW